MPELPEVETIARGLARRVTGDVIESVWLGQKKEPLKSKASEIAAVLEHSQISAVRRMGKHIVFDLARASNGGNQRHPRRKSTTASDKPSAQADRSVRPTGEVTSQWIVHLGMTGRLQVCEPGAEIAKHTHAILKLNSRRELRFVDP